MNPTIITILTAAYVVLLTVLCLVRISASTPDLSIFGFDKLVHFCFYFGLNVLLVSLLAGYKKKIRSLWIVPTTIIAILYGITIEYIQEYVGRDFDVYDIVANSIGAVSAAALLCLPAVKKMIIKYLC